MNAEAITVWALASYAMVAILMVATPGPNGVLILKTVAGSGPRAGFAVIAGFAAAFYLHGTLAIFGLSALLVRSAEAFLVLKILGAFYLFFIGAKALYRAWRGDGAGVLGGVEPQRVPRGLHVAFLEGFVTNALNPKVALFFLAVFPQFAGSGAGIVDVGYALTTVHASMNVLWFAIVVLLVHRVGARLRVSRRIGRWLQAATGTVFVWFGWQIAVYRP